MVSLTRNFSKIAFRKELGKYARRKQTLSIATILSNVYASRMRCQSFESQYKYIPSAPNKRPLSTPRSPSIAAHLLTLITGSGHSGFISGFTSKIFATHPKPLSIRFSISSKAVSSGKSIGCPAGNFHNNCCDGCALLKS